VVLRRSGFGFGHLAGKGSKNGARHDVSRMISYGMLVRSPFISYMWGLLYPFVRQSKKGDILGPQRRGDIQKS
jgi:hypothetical protein